MSDHRPSTASAVATILGKDLRVELRTLQSIPAMVLFATTIYVVFRFGLSRTQLEGGLATGVLLVTVLFAALLAINRIFVPEREQGGFEAVRLAPVDGTALFLAKIAALLVYLLALELVAIPIFWLFFLDDASGLVPMLPVLLLLDLALATLGALISPIATNSTARDLIGPLILLPLLLPPLIAASAAGERLLAAGGPDYEKYGTWLGILGLYDAIFLLIGAGFALVFFYAPNEADQGFIQKIFYLHVPLAIVALGGFIIGGIHAIRHLRTGDPVHDARSYVSIHASVIFGVAVLVTGAIWAKGSWGKWWVWDEPTLVSFLIVFLLYATYYPLRYAIPDRERQARYASVFAITAGAFVPLNFAAVRAAQSLVHPRTFATAEGGMPPKMWLTFAVCFAGIAALWATLVSFELTAKRTSAQLSRLRRAIEGTEPATGVGARIAPGTAPAGGGS